MPPEPDASRPWGERLRWWGFRYAGTLIMERNPDGDYVLSLGRLACVVLLGQAMYKWGVNDADIPAGMLQTLWVFAGYNLGTKGIVAAHSWIAAIGDAKNPNSNSNGLGPS